MRLRVDLKDCLSSNGIDCMAVAKATGTSTRQTLGSFVVLDYRVGLNAARRRERRRSCGIAAVLHGSGGYFSSATLGMVLLVPTRLFLVALLETFVRLFDFSLLYIVYILFA